MRDIRIKICGMKDPDNLAEAVKLKPDYLGFILYKGSPRFVNIETAARLVKLIPESIRRVGVLVNEPIENAIGIAQSGIFDLLQLHGNENIDYCRDLSLYIGIIKAFQIENSLPENLSGFESCSTNFLFDTAGRKFGGSGKKFDHKVLDGYSSHKKYILGGGISPDDSGYIKSIMTEKMAAIDLNSRFETSPGIKNIKLLKEFITKIRKQNNND
jgi:phosphoribosylanthranilate isomerase